MRGYPALCGSTWIMMRTPISFREHWAAEGAPSSFREHVDHEGISSSVWEHLDHDEDTHLLQGALGCEGMPSSSTGYRGLGGDVFCTEHWCVKEWEEHLVCYPTGEVLASLLSLRHGSPLSCLPSPPEPVYYQLISDTNSLLWPLLCP